ncbi:DedA family protein [Jatrophihabitans sp. YIM 134969]
MYQAAPGILDPDYLVNTFGLIGLYVIIFAECGLLIGFFMPGDSLLFAAGLLIASGVFDVPLWAVLVGVPIAASAGSLVGYWIGRKAGPALFDRPDGRIFKRKYVTQAHEFFEARGPFAIIAGRFVPVVRTFITVIAGASRMDFRRYAIFSIGVSVVWGVGFPLLGYFLGGIEFVKNNVEAIALLIAVVSILPVVLEFLKHRRRNKAAAARPDEDPAAVEPPAV